MRTQWLTALIVVSAMAGAVACTDSDNPTATSEPSATTVSNSPTSTATAGQPTSTAASGPASTATVIPTVPPTPTAAAPSPTVATPPPTPATSPAATSSPAPTPSQETPAPGTPSAGTPTPGTPVPGTPEEAFARIGRSVGFVETDIAFGSGMLIEGGYVLTSARVVWPFNEADITFPDGSAFEDVPVAARDLMVDIAILGPVETALEPLTLGSSGSLETGTETVLIGYPGQTGQQGPDPDFAEGVVSEVREWEEAGVTYLRTDHAIQGGHSGGALVSDAGEIVGMSSIAIAETSLALAISSDDLQERIASLLAGEDPSTLGDRQVNLTGGAQSQSYTLSNEWEEKLFAIAAAPESEVTLAVDGQNNAGLEVLNSFGQRVATVNDTPSGTETFTFTLDSGSVYFVIASQLSVASGDFEISCNCDLVPVNDPEEGQELSVGTKTAGSLDIRGDNDMFLVNLNEGDVIEVTLDSGNFDAIAFASWQGAGESELWYDDDSGGGVLGLNSQLVFRAPYTETFIIYVRDVNDVNEGGYVLSVEQVDSDDPRAMPASPETVASEFGQMAVYQFTALPFSVQYPADWTRAAANAGLGVVLSVNGPVGEVFSVAIDDLTTLGQGDLTLQQYGDLVVETQENNGLTVDSRTTITTASGLTVERLEISAGDSLKAVRMAYVHEGTAGISVTIAVSPAAGFDQSEALFDYLLSTFTQTE